MRVIIDTLIQFIKQYRATHWLLLFLFCGLSLTVNYALGLKQWMNHLTSTQTYVVWFAINTLHIGFGYVVYSMFTKQWSYWRKPGFVFLLLFAVVIFSLRETVDWHYDIIAALSAPEQTHFNQSTFKYVFRASYLVLPIVFWWYVNDKRNMPLYGFDANKNSIKLYGMMLLCMIPLIAFASTQTDFLNYYPRVKRIATPDLARWKYLLFELCYGIDFIAIELFFRGLLILGVARYVGIHGVLPMACFYMAIHFGKPMGEALSSFLGGTILGVLAYHSKSIYGGVVVHLGIAWLMELGGFLGNWLRG